MDSRRKPKRTIALTGASGQLGTLVLRRLIDDRNVGRIIAIDRVPPTLISRKIEWLQKDICDTDLDEHLQGADVLIHLAFIVTDYLPRAQFDAINIGGSKNVFRAGAKVGVKQIIYASSLAAYGVVPDQPNPITEDTPRILVEDFPYSAAKYHVEAFLDDFEKEHPTIHVVRFRPSILIGARFNNPLGELFGKAIDRGYIVARKNVPIPIVWDEDVADAFMLACQKEIRGAFNLGAEPLYGPEELARTLGLKVLTPGAFLNALAGNLAKLQVLMGKKDAPDPVWNTYNDITLCQSSAKAKAELGWQPQCFDAVDVVRKYLKVSSGKMDSRLRTFVRATHMMAKQEPRDPELEHLQSDVHLCLSGRGGGDIWFNMHKGRLSARIGVPRPPTSIVRISLSDWYRLLDGSATLSTLTMTGRMQFEGDTSANFILGGIISRMHKERSRTGIRGSMARTFVKFVTKKERT
ncbi:MAG: NAD-dependent epimerase/dehydratase family protein [Myxococcota bacterium]|nr:NAD-dependent epimerase/dehydratase family protein [Myxococcota bacterium]